MDRRPGLLFISIIFFPRSARRSRTELLTDDTRQKLTPGAAYKHVLGYWEHSKGELLQRLLYTDIKTYLVELLMKQDNMSMAASIESRVPFLDHVLVEFATRIPREVQLNGLAGKVHSEESGGRPAAAFDSLPPQAGISDSVERMAGGTAAGCDRETADWNRAAWSADISGARPSNDFLPSIARNIATITTASGGC